MARWSRAEFVQLHETTANMPLSNWSHVGSTLSFEVSSALMRFDQLAQNRI